MRGKQTNSSFGICYFNIKKSNKDKPYCTIIRIRFSFNIGINLASFNGL